jgi:hypothetical protein
MIDERDELIERVAGALKPLPRQNARAMAQILAAVRARRAQAPSRLTLVLEWMRQPTVSVASAALLAAAALAIGFVTRGALSTPDERVMPTAALPSASVPAITAANAPNEVRAVPVPITFDAAGAKSVSIVGDFNDWDGTASPLTRFGANGPWTATVKVMPGRHLYAFMVDGKLVVDPRAPHTRDLDFGGDASVLMVNQP